MWDAEAVGLELAALAGLDRELGPRQLYPVVADHQVRGQAASGLGHGLEPRHLVAAEERVRDRQGHATQRQDGGDPEDRGRRIRS